MLSALFNKERTKPINRDRSVQTDPYTVIQPAQTKTERQIHKTLEAEDIDSNSCNRQKTQDD